MKNSESHTDSNISDPTMQAILRTLDTQAGQYSVATQMRLNEARARAIAATRAKTPFWRSTPFLAAAFAISAAYTFIILTQPHGVPTSAELEATALYEATFGAEVADETSVNPKAFFEPKLDPTVLNETGLDETGLDETGLEESVVANDLEFYAWLSESTHVEHARSGSGS